MQLLKKLWGWIKPDPELAEAAIHTQMWTVGYTDWEIDQAILAYREAKLGKDHNEIDERAAD
jgi:hypothetical protein